MKPHERALRWAQWRPPPRRQGASARVKAALPGSIPRTLATASSVSPAGMCSQLFHHPGRFHCRPGCERGRSEVGGSGRPPQCTTLLHSPRARREALTHKREQSPRAEEPLQRGTYFNNESVSLSSNASASADAPGAPRSFSFTLHARSFAIDCQLPLLHSPRPY